MHRNSDSNRKCWNCGAYICDERRRTCPNCHKSLSQWECSQCKVEDNHGWRPECFRCRAPKPKIWSCECGFHTNYATRLRCHGCNANRPDVIVNEWYCPACKKDNRPYRRHCFSCGAEKPRGPETSSRDSRHDRPYGRPRGASAETQPSTSRTAESRDRGNPPPRVDTRVPPPNLSVPPPPLKVSSPPPRIPPPDMSIPPPPKIRLEKEINDEFRPEEIEIQLKKFDDHLKTWMKNHIDDTNYFEELQKKMSYRSDLEKILKGQSNEIKEERSVKLVRTSRSRSPQDRNRHKGRSGRPDPEDRKSHRGRFGRSDQDDREDRKNHRESRSRSPARPKRGRFNSSDEKPKEVVEDSFKAYFRKKANEAASAEKEPDPSADIRNKLASLAGGYLTGQGDPVKGKGLEPDEAARDLEFAGRRRKHAPPDILQGLRMSNEVEVIDLDDDDDEEYEESRRLAGSIGELKGSDKTKALSKLGIKEVEHTSPKPGTSKQSLLVDITLSDDETEAEKTTYEA